MRKSTLAGAALLVLGLLVAYEPALRGGFVWDDDVYLTKNHLVTAPDGLRRIWLSTDAPSQFFPLVYTSFRLEHALWGFAPLGYHLINLLLHAGNAALLWWILARLGIPGAGLAAALFALHPIQVESVAWVTERKNVLSLLFSLVAVSGWLRYLDGAPGHRWKPYLASITAHLLALFAKTTAVTTPLVLLLLCWLRGERVGRARLRESAPFFAASLALGLLGLWWELHHQGTAWLPFTLSLAERVLTAGRAFWFYLGKLAWPTGLTFIYPRWALDAGVPLSYLGPALAAVAVAAAGMAGKRIGRGTAVSVVFYAVTMAPLSGLIPLYTHRYSFVADHHAYVAVIGPLAALAAVIARGPRPLILARRAATAGLLLVFGLLTRKQAGIYDNAESLWRDTLAKNPGSAIATANLGVLAMREGHLEEAISRFQSTLRIDPTVFEAHGNLGILYTRQGRPEAALAEYREALRINPRDEGIRINYGGVLLQLGRAGEAEAELREVLRLSPKNAIAHYHLGTLRLQAGDLEEAVAHLSEAVRLRPDYANAHYSLGRVLAVGGRPEEARRHFLAAFRELPPEQARAALREVEPLLRGGLDEPAGGWPR